MEKLVVQKRNVDNTQSHECHETNMSLNVTKKSRLADACSVPSVLIHICTIISVSDVQVTVHRDKLL